MYQMAAAATPGRRPTSKPRESSRECQNLELPVARGAYTGLHIELKHGKNTVSPEQKRWLRTLKKMGRCAVVCYEAEAAIKTIQEYLCLWQGERLQCDTGKEYPIIR